MGLFLFGIYGLQINPQPATLKTQTPPSISQMPFPTSNVLPSSDPQKKLLDYIQNRRQLSPSDKSVKQSILVALNGKPSGTIHQNENFIIEYIHSADLFQAEILTTNVEDAKDEVVVWFTNNGLSAEGVCNLPISFYLNFEIKNQFPESEEMFNPLPRGC
jgi:hypothetical protein